VHLLHRVEHVGPGRAQAAAQNAQEILDRRAARRQAQAATVRQAQWQPGPEKEGPEEKIARRRTLRSRKRVPSALILHPLSCRVDII